MRWRVLALWVLASGCRTRPLEPVDDAGAVDLASTTPRDGGADLGACMAHEILFVPLASLTLADPAANVRFGRAIRVRIAVPLREGCDLMGDLHVEGMPGGATDLVRISARAWRGSGACGPVRTTERIVVVSDALPVSNRRLLVRDGAPGGTLELEIRPNPAVPGTCARPPRATCERDCQCQMTHSRERCVPSSPTGVCAISCSGDTECPAEAAFCVANLCVVDRGGCCPQGCPTGQGCSAKCACVPIMTQRAGNCACDRDCPTGQICTNEGSCVMPCTVPSDCDEAVFVTCSGGACERGA